MGILDISSDQMVNAAASMEPPRIPQPKPGPSAWRSVWNTVNAPARGATVGLVAEPLASLAETIGGFGQVLGAYPEAFGYVPTGEARRQADDARAKLLREGVSMNNDVGDSLRRAGASYAPDPETSNVAEQVLYGFARGAAKVVGGAALAGPIGVGAAAVEEANTQADALAQQGVPFGPRVAAGAAQGAGLGLAALPLVGSTLRQTAGLYLLGGPGGFVAQQALTREILQNAGQEQVAMQYDPFDPVGLAVATLLPAGFAAYGLRQQRLQRAADSLPPTLAEAEGTAPLAPAAPDAGMPAAPMPSDLTPIARAAQAYPTEAVDAAMVVHLAEVRARSNPLGESAPMREADQHAAALARAEEQINAGEAVRVSDVAPERITPEQRDANFRAWFGDSKVVDAEGRPLVVYHATKQQFDAFRTEGNTSSGDRLDAAFFSDKPEYSNEYAAVTGRGAPVATVPVYVSLRNPLDVTLTARDFADPRVERAIIDRARADGHDGVVFRDAEAGDKFYAVFRPEQIKSAIGNSGRFDPNSPSLTDPIDQFAQRLAAGLDQMRAEMEAQGIRPPADTTPGARLDAPVTEPGTDAQTTRAAATADQATTAEGGGPAAAADLPGARGGADEAGRVIELDPWEQRPKRDPATLPPAAERADDLRAMGRAAFWAQEGGKILRSGADDFGDGGMGGNVVGRTTWIPAEEWFGRMRAEMGRAGLANQADIVAAVEKAIAGEKLKAAEARTVDWMRIEAEDVRDRYRAAEFTPDEADALAADTHSAGLGGADTADVAMVARAAEIDADRVERAAIQFENDDAAFMAEVRGIIDGNRQAAGTAAGIEGAGPGQGGEGARPAEAAAAGREALTLEAQTPEGLRARAEREAAAEASARQQRAAEQERLRREAEQRDMRARADRTVDDFRLGQTAEQQMSGMGDLFADQPAPGADAVTAQRITEAAARHPDLQVMMDGMDAPMPMAEFMAAVQREADAARADAPDLLDAATCALLNGSA